MTQLPPSLPEHQHHWYMQAMAQDIAARLWRREVEDPFRG